MTQSETDLLSGFPRWVMESLGMPGNPFCGEDGFVPNIRRVVRSESPKPRISGNHGRPGDAFCSDEG